mmetsp:Transcript_8651/g.25992  ORF Transcript_8651/g.25992 Transcript_8651/m.25992 type:complete len:223 (-) Transcript_8651:2514-3182(-)
MLRPAFVRVHVGTGAKRSFQVARMSENGRFFVAQCYDKDGAGDLRAKTRPAHLEWIVDSRVVLGGPLLAGDQNTSPVGSLLVFKGNNLREASDWLQQDPYGQAGLFRDVRLHAWKQVSHPRSALPKALYALVCMDRPDSGALRSQTRPSHLAWWEDSQREGFIGPLLSNVDAKPVGSLIISTAESRDEMGRWAETDPYAKAGLFQDVRVNAMKQVIYHGQLV